MKKIFFPFFAALLILFQGCEGFLDREPLDTLSVDSYFKTEADIKQYVDGLYTSMTPKHEGVGTFEFDYPTDLCWISFRSGFSYQDVGYGIHNAQSWSVSLPYNYAPIRNAYIFFDKIRDVTMTDDAKNLYTGSINYLLAYRYFVMFRAYENVPVVREVLTTENADIPSSPKEEVFAEALKQVNDAITKLPSYGPLARERGRLTKLCALTLKADLLLYTAARYKGAISGATWQTAAEAAQAALTEADANGYGLATNYPNIFIAKHQSTADAQREIILERVQLKNTPNAMQFITNWLWRPRHDGWGISGIGSTQELVDMFECSDGKPINKSILYDPTHPFKNRDPRLTFNVQYPGNTTGFNDGSPQWISNSLDPDPSNRDYILAPQIDGALTGYTNVKYWDREPGTDWISGYGSFVVYRYAELLLMYAEAKNEVSGPDASVYSAISKIRQRAGMPSVTAVTHADQQSVRALIRNERVIELLNEGKRYWDIRRWGIGPTVMNKDFNSMHISKFNADGSFAGYMDKIYVRTSLSDPTQESLFEIPNGANGGNLLYKCTYVSPKYDVWPIPQSAIDKSYTHALTQHPLWQ